MAIAALMLFFACPALAHAEWIVITVDKAAQKMTVSVDGKQEYDWPVSTGDLGYNTPIGIYRPLWMKEKHFSQEWDNAPMPHAIFFTEWGHAIHGSREVKRLGRPASHGCVRLSRTNAATLYQLVQEAGMENTMVVIGGEEKWPDDWVFDEQAY